MTRAALAASCLVVAVACASSPPAAPTAIPTPLPTRAERSSPTPSPAAEGTRTPEPSPAGTPTPPRVFTLRDVDPYFDLYATERDGLWVTTRNPRGRYYYRWDDRRWYALEDRVWFYSAEDLLTVFPSRAPAP
ncbi:MAG TPA: hypothetical protein VGM69_06735 [Chloroflexota bacterium]|jgi:hypothetical protein